MSRRLLLALAATAVALAVMSPSALAAADCAHMPGCSACEEVVVTGGFGRGPPPGNFTGGFGRGPPPGNFTGGFGRGPPPGGKDFGGRRGGSFAGGRALLGEGPQSAGQEHHHGLNASAIVNRVRNFNATAVVNRVRNFNATAAVNRVRSLNASAIAGHMHALNASAAVPRRPHHGINATAVVNRVRNFNATAAVNRVRSLNASAIAGHMHALNASAAVPRRPHHGINASAIPADFNASQLAHGPFAANETGPHGFGGRHHGGHRALLGASTTGGNFTVLRCSACAAPAYELSAEGRCECAPGYGRPRPDFNGTAPAQPPAQPPTPPACQRCPAGFVSGPNAPAPQPPAFNASQPMRPHGPDGPHGGPHGGRPCVACPTGTTANADQTRCV